MIALALCLAASSQAALFVAAPPASTAAPSTSENASTAFFESGSESQIGLLCGNDPLDKTDPTGLDFRGEDVPFQFVPKIARKLGQLDEFGETEFSLDAKVRYSPTADGFVVRMDKLNITILSRQVQTESNVRGHDRARSQEAVDATVKHEKLHGKDAKDFHDANQTRTFPGRYPTEKAAEKAANEAGEQIMREFKENQKHVPAEKWQAILREERSQ
ncbi:MAG: DUF922 domain-containing protein [Chthoniobacterales bacterium]|nr:DUF922 domain-containing protein [Chthoniobacterales bacterium]